MTAPKISTLLIAISNLLTKGDSHDWVKATSNLAEEVLDSPKDTCRKILHLYGGSNSFQDLLIYKNGVLLTSETNDLYAMRSKLFALCVDEL